MSVVYFVAGGPYIKIGTSVNAASRLASLQTSTVDELRLLGTIPGDASKERDIHKQLAAYRKRGEWFLDCAEVRAAIIELCGADVFAVVQEEPQPSPLGDFDEKLEEILNGIQVRLVQFVKFCLEDHERNKGARLWRLHVTQRHMICAVLSHGQRAVESLSDDFMFSDSEDYEAVGRAVASLEMLECQVEIILGGDTWFLDGWERVPRSNPLFETKDGKVRWQTREEAAADGWVKLK